MSYIKLFIRSNGGFMGGFQIAFTDEEMTAITKQPHLYIDPRKFEDGGFVIDVDRYKHNEQMDRPFTMIAEYKNLLKYGDT